MPVEPMNILVVDDSMTVRRTIRDELEHGGYDVVEAADGIEALIKSAEAPPPALITLDIEMPKLNGFDTCKKLRKEHYARFFTRSRDGQVPIIFVTGNDTIQDRNRGFELGAADFITKPFEKGEILAAVNKMLKPESSLQDLVALVVDDSTVARRIVSEALQREGLTVVEAEDGMHAFEIMESKMAEIDIVITDLMMPRMDGMELCRKIRNHPDIPHLPIIFLTGAEDQSQLLEIFKAGATDYLVKPFLKEELLARLSVQLERIQLNRRELRAADELKDLEHMKDDLLAVCTHDLYLPMNGVLESADLLLEKDYLKPVDLEIVTRIKTSIAKLQRVLYDILDLSEVETEKADELADILSQEEDVPQRGTPTSTGDAGLKTETEESREILEDEDIFDRNELMERVDGDEDFAKELLVIFMEDTLSQMEKLNQALKDKDPAQVEHQAHTIKGSSANIGARRLTDTAFEMEMTGKDGDIESARALMKKLEKEFEKLRRTLSYPES